MITTRNEEFIVMEESPERMIDRGYSIMSYAREIRNLNEAKKEAEDVRENLISVREVVISRYGGIYDVYAKTNEEAIIAA